jgi:hypothetical protein
MGGMTIPIIAAGSTNRSNDKGSSKINDKVTFNRKM